MEEFQHTDEDYNLWWLMLLMRRIMYKARARELFQYRITPEQAAILFIVQAIGEKATPAEISRWLFREPHSVSGLLARMEKQGLVRKVKDLERKNLVRVVITEEGQQAYQQSTKRESIHRIMSSLSEEDRQQLRSYLEVLQNKALEELGVNRKLPLPNSNRPRNLA